MEITPEGAIAIRAQKPLELPSPKELGGKIKDRLKETTDSFFSGRRKIKENSQMLSSIIASIGDRDTISSWTEEQQRKFFDLQESIMRLSQEKPKTVKRVFEEVLPRRLEKKRIVAKDFANLLVNPPESRADWQKAEENLAKDLTVMFQRRGRGGGARRPAGPSPDWNFIIGRTPEPPRERPEERTRREREELTGAGLEIRERRRALGRVATIVGGILLVITIAERGGSTIPVSPATYLFQEKEWFGYQKPEKRLFIRPFTEKALSGTSDYTINEWFGAIYNTEETRKNVLDPHKYDEDGKSNIEEASKMLKDVHSDKIAKTLSARGIYQNPTYHDGLVWTQAILTAWREDRTIDPQDAQHFRDNYFIPVVGFLWLEKIPQEE